MGRARQGAEHGDWWKEGAGSQVREDGGPSLKEEDGKGTRQL